MYDKPNYLKITADSKIFSVSASGQKWRVFRGGEFFAREPMGFPARRRRRRAKNQRRDFQ